MALYAHFDFWKEEPTTQTCCWYILINFGIRPLASLCAEEHWARRGDCALCEATQWQKFFAMRAKPFSELSNKTQSVFSDTVGVCQLHSSSWHSHVQREAPVLFCFKLKQSQPNEK